MTVECYSVTVITPASITVTAFTVTPTATPCVYGTCIVDVHVEWTNSGQATGAIIPDITIGGMAYTIPTPDPVDVAGGITLIRDFGVMGLPAGPHEICPTPNP